MCTCLFGLKTTFCESCTECPTVFQWKSEHLLVQNKVQVKSTIAGRPCTPAVMDLSCAAGHQGHHHDAHFHAEQDLPAAAQGHHSECRWEYQLDSSKGSVQMVSSQRWLSWFPSHSWRLLSAMPCRAISKALERSSLDQWDISQQKLHVDRGGVKLVSLPQTLAH